MAQGEVQVTVVGNLVTDPELRFTSAGVAVTNFRIASTPRFFNKRSNQWEDGDAIFLTCNVWRQVAENVAKSLRKGMRVIVQGTLSQRSFETYEGERRTVMEINVEEVGPSLLFATAQVHRSTSELTNAEAGQGSTYTPRNQQGSNNQNVNNSLKYSNDEEPPF